MLFKLRPVIRIAFIEIALLAVLLLSALYFVKTSNEKQLEVRAHTSAQLLATMTSNAVVALDLATLDALVSEAMKNSDIIFVRVRDRDGVELSKYGRPPKKNIVDTFDETSRISEGRIDVTTSISIESVNFGFVDMGLETKFLHATLVEAAKWMLFVAGVQLILVGLLGISLGSALTNQLTALKDAAQRVAAGGLGFQTGVQGDNELANVARSFNTMSSSLALLVRGLKQARIDAEKEREAAESILQDVVLNLSEGVLISNSRGQIIHINEKFNEIHDDNFSRSKIQDLRTFDLLLAKEIGFIIKGQASEEQLTVGNNDCKIVSPFIEFSSTCLKGQWTCCYVNQKIVLYTASPLSNGGHLFIASDITFIHQFEKLAKRLQRELAQSRKMEAAGALAGGISHELNTPMQLVGDNLSFIKIALTDLSEIIDQHISLLESLEDNSEMEDSSPMAEALKASDYEFLKVELPKAIEQSINGINQMANNVLAMKECAHPTQKERSDVVVNNALKRASVLSWNEWKYVAQLDWELCNLPILARVNESDLDQVILNILVNAAHAIKSAERRDGRIQLKTSYVEDKVIISIADNGTGIPVDIRQRVYDEFFTTKDVNEGAGLGLALCYDFIVNGNGGKIYFETEEQVGTTFFIELPFVGLAETALSA